MFKKIFLLLPIFGLFFTLLAYANSGPLSTSVSISSESVKPSQEFTVNINLQNVTSSTIYDVLLLTDSIELNYADTTFLPDTNIGNLSANAKKSLTIKYKVQENAPSGKLLLKDTNIEKLDISVSFKTSQNGSATVVKSSVNLPTVQDIPPKIATLTLPVRYTKSGSESTSLKSITKQQAASYPNFRLDDTDFNQVVFTENINLTDENILAQIPKIDEVVNVSEYGKIGVDVSKATYLNKKATLIFRNLKFKTLPKIFKDGEEIDANSSLIKNLKFDATGKSLIFDVSGFSTYALGPVIKLTSLTSTETQNTLNGNVNDPTSSVRYSMDGGKTFKRVVDLDVDKGTFIIKLPKEFDKSLFLIDATSLTGMKDQVDLSKIETQVTPTPTSVNSDKKEEYKAPFNTLLAYSIIGTLGILVVFIIVIVVIVRKLKKDKLSKESEELKTDIDDLINPESVKVKVRSEKINNIRDNNGI